MAPLTRWFAEHAFTFLRAGIAFGLSFGLLWIAKSIFLRTVARIAGRTEPGLDQRVRTALETPGRLLVFFFSTIPALSVLTTADYPITVPRTVYLCLLVLFLYATTAGVTRVVILILNHYLYKSGGQPVTTLTALLIRTVVATPAALVLLRAFDISLTPYLTFLGAGGIAVGLAFKDTLANIFSGFYVSLAGTFHPGDYIRLDNGPEGYVVDIQWRMTTIRTLQNNLAMIPNAKLAETIVTNCSFPEKRVAVQLLVNVDCASDIDQVSRVLSEVAAQALDTAPGVVHDHEPSVRLNRLAEYSLEFSIGFHVVDFAAQFAALDHLRRLVVKRLRDENISMPFPVRTLDLSANAAALLEARGNVRPGGAST